MQYSKLLPVVTGIIYIVCLSLSFSKDMSSYMDTSLYVTIVTVSGGIFGTTLIWYMKKAQAENSVKIKMSLYKAASRERLKYNEEMMKLKQQYNTTDEDVNEIENNSFLDEASDAELQGAENTADSAIDEANSSIELQSY